jgi:hypothetical protein
MRRSIRLMSDKGGMKKARANRKEEEVVKEAKRQIRREVCRCRQKRYG